MCYKVYGLYFMVYGFLYGMVWYGLVSPATWSNKDRISGVGSVACRPSLRCTGVPSEAWSKKHRNIGTLISARTPPQTQNVPKK